MARGLQSGFCFTMTRDQPAPEVQWLTSGATRKALRVSSCHLMHLREAGVLRFRKEGNAYLYSAADVKRQAAKSGK
jgi:hypothetical protein